MVTRNYHYLAYGYVQKRPKNLQIQLKRVKSGETAACRGQLSSPDSWGKREMNSACATSG